MESNPSRIHYQGMAKPSPSHSGSPVLVNLGKTIRSIRERKGLSQESAALISGLDRSYFGGVERGEHNIALINIEKIAIALEISLKDLFESKS